MTIDLTNYEEYFLLYADNELSAKDKAVVEALVENHPELKEEFEAILQTIFSADDDARLNNKSFLYRNDSFINTSNYEEILVQYFDNELEEAQVAATEHFLAQHPQFNKEAELIKRTKISPDKLVVFPDKELLYRKAERVKVIPVIWYRLAAAAVLLGFGFWFGSSYINKTKVAPTVNTSAKKTIPSPVQIPAVVNVEDTATLHDKANQLVVVAPASKKDIAKKTSLEIGAKPSTSKVIKADVAITNTKLSAIKNMNTSSPKTVDEHLIKVDKDVRATIIEKLKKENDVAIVEKDDEILNPKPAANIYPIRTAYIEERNPDYIFNMPEEKFNKTKVGSFLKKVKRNIERRLPFNGSGD